MHKVVHHWNVFNKDCSENCCSRLMLFCSSGPNSWKMLCIFASLLFEKLTLSEVLSKILKKVLWLLLWVAASNLVKRNEWWVQNLLSMQYKNSKITKKWTDRETYFRQFRSFDSLFLIVSMSARFFNIFQAARKNNLFGCISFNHFVQALFIYFHYKSKKWKNKEQNTENKVFVTSYS